MKNKIPSEGLRLGRDSGSILCDTLKKVAFSDSLGGGKERFSNLELYRIICMMLIVAHHCVVNSGLTSPEGPMSENPTSVNTLIL